MSGCAVITDLRALNQWTGTWGKGDRGRLYCRSLKVCIPLRKERREQEAHRVSALESMTFIATPSGMTVPNSFSTARGSLTTRALYARACTPAPLY